MPQTVDNVQHNICIIMN